MKSGRQIPTSISHLYNATVQAGIETPKKPKKGEKKPKQEPFRYLVDGTKYTWEEIRTSVPETISNAALRQRLQHYECHWDELVKPSSEYSSQKQKEATPKRRATWHKRRSYAMMQQDKRAEKIRKAKEHKEL